MLMKQTKNEGLQAELGYKLAIGQSGPAALRNQIWLCRMMRETALIWHHYLL